MGLAGILDPYKGGWQNSGDHVCSIGRKKYMSYLVKCRFVFFPLPFHKHSVSMKWGWQGIQTPTMGVGKTWEVMYGPFQMKSVCLMYQVVVVGTFVRLQGLRRDKKGLAADVDPYYGGWP